MFVAISHMLTSASIPRAKTTSCTSAGGNTDGKKKQNRKTKRLHLVQQRVLPQAENHHEAAIPGPEGSEEVLFGLNIRMEKEAEQSYR